MKKKWMIAGIMAVLAVIVVVILLTLLLPSYEQTDDAEQSISFEEDLWSQVTNCRTTVQKDGTIAVVLTAPDYAQLIKQLPEEAVDVATENMMLEMVKTNPQAIKEYSFIARSSKDEDIKKALIEQISYELIALTLVDVGG